MDPGPQSACSSPCHKKRKSGENEDDYIQHKNKPSSTGADSRGSGGVKTQSTPVSSGDGSDKKTSTLKDRKIFDGDKIFILESGIGKARTNLFKKQVKNNGGNISEKYSSQGEITHIVVDVNMDAVRMFRVMGITDPEMVIASVNIVKCSWLSACLKEKNNLDLRPFLLDTSCIKSKEIDDKIEDSKEHPVEDKMAGEVSNVAPCGSSFHFGSKKTKHVEETIVESDYSSSEGEDGKKSEFLGPSASAYAPKKPLPKGSWACAKASSQVQVNHNKDVTDKLEALAKIYENTNDKWRALGYSKAIAALKRHPKKITTFEEAKALNGVGEKLANKVWEIIESGELRKLDEISSSSEIQAINLFTNIWGAGAATARQWVSLGYRTLDDIRDKAKLTKQQKVGLMYYDELLDRMSREEAGEIEATVIRAAHELNPGLVCQACGSYRRGKATCGDVDVLVTHPDGKSHVGIFSKLLDSLHKSNFLTDDLVKQEDDGTQKKYLGVCKLPGENRKHRRLDIIVVPYDEYACALMYFTGSAHFNRSMRHLAGKMNMSLSEHSLNVGVVRSRGEKINKGTPLPTPTEESVFKHLGLPYRSPEERNH